MNEAQVQSFWQARPWGNHQVGLDQAFAWDYVAFFREYDAFRCAKAVDCAEEGDRQQRRASPR